MTDAPPRPKDPTSPPLEKQGGDLDPSAGPGPPVPDDAPARQGGMLGEGEAGAGRPDRGGDRPGGMGGEG
jgi:hypothetical protein